MKVSFQGRDVTPSDRGEIGQIDLEDNNKWTKIGETVAWNWQQGCRLTCAAVHQTLGHLRRGRQPLRRPAYH